MKMLSILGPGFAYILGLTELQESYKVNLPSVNNAPSLSVCNVGCSVLKIKQAATYIGSLMK